MTDSMSCFPCGNPRGKQVFEQLLKWSEEEKYDDDYLRLLIEYQGLYCDSPNFDIFYAKYALFYKNYAVALEYAKKAERTRKVNLEVWKILTACYKKTGNPLKTIVYEGFMTKFYNLPVCADIPRNKLAKAKSLLTKAMGIGNYAPFAGRGLEIDSKVNAVGNKGVLAGQFLEMFNKEDQLYWTGVFSEQENLDAKGWLVSAHINDEQFVNYCGADCVFDVMRADELDSVCFSGEEQLLLPIAGSEENQQIDFCFDGRKDSAWLGKWAFSWFRADKPLKIFSDKKFIVGKPARLGHSTKRKKLVLNILVDALSWAVVKQGNYQLVPNIMRFFEKGIIFDNHYSVSEYTFPSLPTIETGLYPHHSQIFNERASHELSADYKTLSEQMASLGYYCINVMGSGDGIYNGCTRGYDRLIVNSYALHTYVGVERTIRQLEAFSECDQFLWMHTMDTHPWTAKNYQVPLTTQTKLSIEDRLTGTTLQKASVYLPYTPLYGKANEDGIRNADRSLGSLFDYIESHYNEDDYIVMLYSDHGVPVYDEYPDILSDNQTNAALMVRGGGVPCKGIVHELTSAVDIYSILGKLAGFEVPRYTDGNLPFALGGMKRDYAISNSIFPGQTYKLAIRTAEYVFRLESRERVDEDGTVDLSDAGCRIFQRVDGTEVFDRGLFDYFIDIAKKHTASFNNEGHYWPSMRNARPGWFEAR